MLLLEEPCVMHSFPGSYETFRSTHSDRNILPYPSRETASVRHESNSARNFFVPPAGGGPRLRKLVRLRQRVVLA
jgi:hypothetical protein